jgi:hypothetical protein
MHTSPETARTAFETGQRSADICVTQLQNFTWLSSVRYMRVVGTAVHNTCFVDSLEHSVVHVTLYSCALLCVHCLLQCLKCVLSRCDQTAQVLELTRSQTVVRVTIPIGQRSRWTTTVSPWQNHWRGQLTTLKLIDWYCLYFISATFSAYGFAALWLINHMHYIQCVW